MLVGSEDVYIRGAYLPTGRRSLLEKDFSAATPLAYFVLMHIDVVGCAKELTLHTVDLVQRESILRESVRATERVCEDAVLRLPTRLGYIRFGYIRALSQSRSRERMYASRYICTSSSC